MFYHRTSTRIWLKDETIYVFYPNLYYNSERIVLHLTLTFIRPLILMNIQWSTSYLTSYEQGWDLCAKVGSMHG
jgi:hypothetical protein